MAQRMILGAMLANQSFTGYVLSDEGNWLVALRNDNRAVYYIPDVNVTKRQICQLSAAPQKEPLVAFLPGQENKPVRTPLCGSPSALPPILGQVHSHGDS